MLKIKKLIPIHTETFVQMTILKSMMYCGVLWGLYHDGWAMSSDQEDHIFPFWFSHLEAQKYADQHWPHYQPKKIKPEDFEKSLLPTLKRLNIRPVLYRAKGSRLKLNFQQMRAFFTLDQAITAL